MRLLFFAPVLFFGLALHAQNDSVKKGNLSLISTADSTFAKVEVESSFPGGNAGWARFLNENLQYPKKAIKKNIQGTVLLQFIVEKDGSISDLEAYSGPELLRKAALDVLTNSPKWIPAWQNGKKVRSYKKQPIVFRLE